MKSGFNWRPNRRSKQGGSRKRELKRKLKRFVLKSYQPLSLPQIRIVGNRNTDLGKLFKLRTFQQPLAGISISEKVFESTTSHNFTKFCPSWKKYMTKICIYKINCKYKKVNKNKTNRTMNVRQDKSKKAVSKCESENSIIVHHIGIKEGSHCSLCDSVEFRDKNDCWRISKLKLKKST